jgi:hypothetical protein
MAADDDDNKVDGNGATGDDDGYVSYYNIVKLIILSHEEPYKHIGHNVTLPLFTLSYPLPGKMDYPKVLMK